MSESIWLNAERRAEIGRINESGSCTSVRFLHTRSLLWHANAADKRIEVLEEAITEVSLRLCSSDTPEAKAAMAIFGKVMDAAAMKRMGI